jgi:hypothetical protein
MKVYRRTRKVRLRVKVDWKIESENEEPARRKKDSDYVS